MSLRERSTWLARLASTVTRVRSQDGGRTGAGHVVHGGVCAGAMLLGWWAGALFWQDGADALASAQQALQDLQMRLTSVSGKKQAQASLQAPRHAVAPTTEVPGPQLQPARVWAGLQQGLQQHGLQVLALRPGALEQREGLGSQTLTLELQGRWQDWCAFEEGWGAVVPGWLPERWQVTAQADGDGRMKLLWHWRVDAHAELAHLAAAGPTGAPLRQATPTGTGAVQAGAPDVRLYGTWMQAGVWHALLALGDRELRVAPGQSLQPAGWWVQEVGADAVRLGPGRAGGPGLHLPMQGKEQP